MKLSKEEKWLKKKINKMTNEEFAKFIYKTFVRNVYYNEKRNQYEVFNYFGKCYLVCNDKFMVYYWLSHVEL